MMFRTGAFALALSFVCSLGCSSPPSSNPILPTDLGGVLTDGGAPADTVVPPTDGAGTDGAMPTGCHSDRDCPGQVCDQVHNVCVECVAATDCATGQMCQSNHCVMVTACVSSRMCPGQVCDTSRGLCVDCVMDTDCTTGMVCHASRCAAPPRMCRSSRECSDINQVCDPIRNQCVDCVADTDCTMGQFCRADATCQADVCTPASTRCMDPMHQQTCSARGSEYLGSPCPAGQTCRGDHCQTPVCTPGAATCADSNTRSVCNADGSGTTMTACAATESCTAGACVARSCVPGAATCADMVTRAVCNPDGLSQSVSPCPASQSCVSGSCVPWTCTPGAATCVDTATRSVCNPDGLGSAPAACGASSRCVSGVCAALMCTPGVSHCVDAHTVQVCNVDGTSQMTLLCPSTSTCSGDTCSSWVCTPGMTTCPTSTTRALCNPDGLATTTAVCPLPAGATVNFCTAGACGFTCAAGVADCNLVPADGCETMTATSVANCGTCGHACGPRANSATSCASGVCTYTCLAGYTDCDGNPANGCEALVASDPANCGACSHACAALLPHATATCTAGVCGSRCAAGYGDCDSNPANGCETATDTNTANCGACGHACAAGSACVAGSCGVLVNGLGGPSGFGGFLLPPSDDGSSAVINLTPNFPGGLNIYGHTVATAYVNNNGNISFNAAVSTFTPAAWPTTGPAPIVAGWLADVDTRGGGQPARNDVDWDIRPGQFITTWYLVGYYAMHDTLANTFQVVIRGGAGFTPGDFDLEFRYQTCQWTTGDASGGMGGLGGTPARAGVDAADSVHSLSLPNSGTAMVLSLCTTSNIGTPGVWRYSFRGGVPH